MAETGEEVCLRNLLAQYKLAVEEVASQNKFLDSLAKMLDQFVTKEDIENMKEKTISKMERAIKAIAKKLLVDIEKKLCEVSIGNEEAEEAATSVIIANLFSGFEERTRKNDH